MKINLLTVCTDAYPIEYARKTVTQFQRLTNLEVTPYCITDRPDEVRPFATPLKQSIHTKGWWNKILTYDKDSMPEGWNLYLDLDIVMLHNFDDEIRFAINANKKIACVSDAIRWHNNKFSSSMMIFETGRMHDVYERFKLTQANAERQEGGDQVWTGPLLNEEDILYLDEVFPTLKANLKFHLGKKVMGQWTFPRAIPKSIKMVDCGGRPKPHDLASFDYIRNNWHLV